MKETENELLVSMTKRMFDAVAVGIIASTFGFGSEHIVLQHSRSEFWKRSQSAFDIEREIG